MRPAALVAILALASCRAQTCDPAADGLAVPASGWATDFCTRAVPLAEFRSGGPARDEIPPIDAPHLVSTAEARAWLRDAEQVVLFSHGGDVRAYPLQILVWHEIVNDAVGGRPVAVTYCPLCNAGIVYDRPEVNGETLTFGTTGNLRRSDLVMWDRQTESWWQQFTGDAVVGALTGTTLAMLPSALVSFGAFRTAHPEGRVLARPAASGRPYGRNPYVGYDDPATAPFLYDGPVGPRLPAKAHVVGVVRGDAARAYAVDDLRDRGAIADTLGGEPLVVFWTPGAASALDAAQVAGGRDVGQAGVFVPRANGQALTFTRNGGGFRDAETGSTWTVLGRATAGPLAGAQLAPVAHHAVFWFVWSAFQPAAGLYAVP